MEKLITNNFLGVFTNADPLDIPDGSMLVLKNMYPKNGRLVKTFGAGELLGTASANAFDNLFTYIESHISTDGNSGDIIIGIYINGYTVAVYGWGVTSIDWVAMSVLFSNWTGTYYHKNEKNPIVVQDNILRLLPGNVGTDGTHECIGIWFGYIDRDYFDGNYVAGSEYTAAFFNYDTTVPAPTIGDFTYTVCDGGKFNPDGNEPVNIYYYRMSYVYDGIQESLLSDPVGVMYGDDQHLKISFSIVMANHNKRITGIKLYRSAEEYEVSLESAKTTVQKIRHRATDPIIRRGQTTEGEVITDALTSILAQNTTNYHHILTIDLLRESGKFLTAATGLYWCHDHVWIPGLSETLDGVSTYKISLDGGDYIDIDNTEVIADLVHRTTGSYSTEYWNVSWALQKDANTTFETGTSGAFCGPNVVKISGDLGINQYVGGIIYHANDATKPMLIEKCYNYVASVTSRGTGTEANGTWWAVKPADGLYISSESGGTWSAIAFDNRISDGESHPLPGEVSTKVNGRYAKIIGERLWQADVVLDPGGENEAHDDWATYSEIAQYDVNPVSNVIMVGDESGGAVTGLHGIMNNPVFCKKHSIVEWVIRDNAVPSTWTPGKCPHHIGNLAVKGSISVLDRLYVCYIDGIYELTQNNLAASDSTPTNLLKISDPIGDIYQGISDKTVIISGYEPRKNEIIFILDSSNTWAFSIETRQWREIDSNNTITIFASDENGDLIAYASDKKVYAFDLSESVTSEMKTKVYELSLDDNGVPVQFITITYKSASALTMKVYTDDVVESGKIEYEVVYEVTEDPYVNGSTYTVTYNGIAYHHNDTFTGVIGVKSYTVSGTGYVERYTSFTLPANTNRTPYTVRLGKWCSRMKIEITSAAGTTGVEIDQIAIEHE